MRRTDHGALIKGQENHAGRGGLMDGKDQEEEEVGDDFEFEF